MLDTYPAAKWDPEVLDRKIEVAIENLKNRAKPGYPYQRNFGSNIELLDFYGKEWLFKVVKERFLRIERAPPEAFDGSWPAAKLVAEGLCDPIRVFVKNELHSQKKVDAGRWRTIWSVSIVDQCIDRVLCAKQNEAEKSMWALIPSKPGMSLTDEGLAEITRRLKQMVRPAGTDVRGWDMCVKQWALDWDAEMRAMSAGFNPGDHMWKRMARIRGLSLLVFSDGFMSEQEPEFSGLIKSGAVFTSSSGSKIRVMKHKLATENPSGDAAAMGDDCTEDLPVGWSKQQLKDAYTRVGIDIKSVETFEHDGAVEFCSYRFHADGRVETRNVAKKVLTFMYNWPEPSEFEIRLDALINELRHSPEKDQALEVIQIVAQHMSARGGAQN